MSTLCSKLARRALALAVVALSASPAWAQKVIKLGHFGPGGDPFSQSILAYAKAVEDLSGGTLKLQVYPAAQLGNEKQQLGALQGGLQEMLVTSTSNLTNLNERFRLLDLPFVFGNYREADAVTTGPLADKLMEPLVANKLVGLALWENGFRAVSNSKRPITQLADFKGLKMRVIGAPVFIDTFSALGTNPVPLPFPELYSALETRTVDGQDNPAMAVQVMKIYEAQKYLTLSNHMYGAMVLLAGKPFLDSLTAKDREVLRRAAVDFGATQRKLMRDAESKAIAFLGAEGKMQIVPALGAAQLAELRAAVKPVVDKSVTAAVRPHYDDMLATIAKAGGK